MAFNLLDFDEERIDLIQESIKDARLNIHKCPVCQTLTDKELCQVCSDDTRNKDVLCIVEDSKIVFLFEKMGMYKGKYHVLGGVLSALDGIAPEDLNIESLLCRIKKDGIKEVILALPATVDGQITSHYLVSRLKDTEAKVTTLAQGIPMGAELDYMDEGTLQLALNSRKLL